MVLRRDEADRRHPEGCDRRGDQAGIDHHHPLGTGDQLMGEAGIAVAHPLEAAIEGIGRAREHTPDPALGLALVMLEQHRGERRGERQRHEQRDGGGDRDRDRELLVESARQTVEEQGRQEHREQHQHDRDQRARHFVHRGARRLERRHAMCQVALDILDHDDRVVDDDADGEHQTEQRQVVERIAQRQQHRHGADQRDGDRHHRDDRRPPLLEEHDHDEDDEHHRFAERMVHRVDRLGDELGGVVDHAIFEALGEGLRDRVHLRLDPHRGGERVGARALEGGQDHGRLVREIGVGGIVGGTQLDARDVAHADLAALRIGADDDAAELGRGLEAALRLDVELEGIAGGRRAGLAERTRGDLDVLPTQRLDDVARGEVQRGGAAGIDPHAHRIVTRAEHAHVTHAFEPREAVLHLRQGVVGDVAAIDRIVGRDQVDDHQEVGAGLAGDDAEALHLFRQSRNRDRDAVLHQHLRGIEVGAGLEGDGDRHIAVAGRLRRLVEHVVDAVDFLLDRRRDGFRHGLGRGAGIACRHRDRWRHDVGILRDGQREIGDAAQDRDDDRDHRREDRAGDEEA